MRVEAVRAANPWSRYALIVLLTVLATWLLVQLLNERSIISALLFALFATLTALCIVARRGGTDPVMTVRRNVWLFPAVCSVIALAMSIAGLNGSSSAELFSAVDGAPSSHGLILGETKFIRSDEWAVYTPWLLSQAKQIHPFSSRNLAVGGQHSPLVCSNLPVARWTLRFRAELWP